MAVIALAGLPGAPGVTTTALALLQSWPLEDDRRTLLAECDPDGGAVLAGALQSSLRADIGLRNLAVSRRGEQPLPQAFWTQLVRLGGDDGAASERHVLLPGLPDPSLAPSLKPEWPALADLFVGIDRLSTHPHDVLIDLGRSGVYGPTRVLAQRADLVLLVMRGTLRSLHAAKSRVPMVQAALEDGHGGPSPSLGILLITQGSYGKREVESELETRVITTLPYRPEEAAVLSDGAPEPRKFARSPLMKAAREACPPLQQLVLMRRSRLRSPMQQRLAEVRRAR
ncbi:hypothetical protein G3I40_27725 [Streptomyces sp. SID14478]|uniref:hypothetical protein n=1 Tax=Streptomyces sp. SID14478 TaxID=2706073 RepID=UPI0013DC249C|nr:hypothetical protein [Streptomyces sp. SID14478]NEB78980.1 hypothetical protein [Streptomyces sp. SID14478]